MSEHAVLVKRLRDSKGWPTLGNAAADRITELECERDASGARVRALEAFLRLVDEYERSSFCGPDGEKHKRMKWRGITRKARALLKGTDHDR